MFNDSTEELFYSLYYSSGRFICDYKKEERIKEILEQNKGLLFKAKDVSEESLTAIKQTIEELIGRGYDMSGKFIGIEYSKFRMGSYFTTNDCEKLIDFEGYLEQQQAELTIVAEDIFSLNDILITNSKLNAEVDYINSLTVPNEGNRPLNDVEKFLMVYDFCTNFKYQENNNNRFLARNLTSIMNSTNIVCVGYAELMFEMCKRLGIECHTIGSTIINKKTNKTLGGHRNNIVILDNQIYYADACWDSQRKDHKGLKSYNYCLIPVRDKNTHKELKIEYSGSPFEDIKGDIKQAKNLIKAIEESCYGKEETEKGSTFTFKFQDVLEKEIKDVAVDYNWDQTKEDFETFSKRRYGLEVIMKLNIIIDFLRKYEYADGVSYEDISKALLNVNLAKGMQERAAESLMERTMEINTKRAGKIFDSNATNCFSVGRTEELEV